MGYPTTRVGNKHRWREEPEMMMSNEELDIEGVIAERTWACGGQPTCSGCDQDVDLYSNVCAKCGPRCPMCGGETAFYSSDHPSMRDDQAAPCDDCVQQADEDHAADLMADRIADGYLPPGRGA